mmetsp:Transcript_2360/g.6396  ORF Transcript_2360/g.6396 Transcript_2360/m.6396 type:complete len:282 (+) Transcript_2360:38-883(+)
MKTAAQLRALRQSFNVNKWNPKASEEIKEFGTPMLGLWRAVGSVLRTFGQSVESMGAGFQSSTAYEETLSKHQAVAPFESRVPALSAKSFVAPSATVLGQVSMGAGSSVWYGACIRGDTHPVSIGKRTSIQDRATVHCDSGPAAIGNNVSIGAGSRLHACTLEDGAVVGVGAVLLDGVHVEQGGFVAAGAVVPPQTRIPSAQIWAGNPAKFLRNVSEAEVDSVAQEAEEISKLAEDHALEHSKDPFDLACDRDEREFHNNRDQQYESSWGFLDKNPTAQHW